MLCTSRRIHAGMINNIKYIIYSHSRWIFIYLGQNENVFMLTIPTYGNCIYCLPPCFNVGHLWYFIEVIF